MRVCKSTILALGLALGPIPVLGLGLTIQMAHASGPSVASQLGGKTTMTASEQVTKRAAGEKAILECLQMWDAGTHMTKQDWARTCRRVQDRLHQFDVR